jgi:hypothetical protein
MEKGLFNRRTHRLCLWVALGLFVLVSLTFPAKISGHSSELPGRKKVIIQAEPVSVYQVARLKKPIKIDGDWSKSQWKKIKEIPIRNYMGAVPKFQPSAKAKMMYDKNNLYVIFHVDDQYVSSVVEEFNGSVFNDACVEFFFAPDASQPNSYFNLETNAGGVPLMHQQIFGQKEQKLTVEDLSRIEIAHSLPKKVYPEITEPVTWTLEYRIPIDLLRKFASVTEPKPGAVWRANFYKTATKTSNPHYMTWSFVDNPRPQFHLPQFFGTLRFK